MLTFFLTRRGAVRFKFPVSPPIDLSGLPRPELEALVGKLLGEVADLKELVTKQREEIARLKGVSPRPRLKPSGMERAGAPASSCPDKRRCGGKSTPRVRAEEQVLRIAAPAGSRFKGYESFVVQDLERTGVWVGIGSRL